MIDQKILPSVRPLLDELKNTPHGAIEGHNRDKILGRLANCWQELIGADDTSMKD
jgi:hypothetical protein